MGLRDTKNVQDSASLADLGMDSLMGAEIKQTLERNFDIVMSPQEIRQLTFGQLKQLSGGEGNEASAVKEPYSVKSVISNVLNKLAKRSAQNRNGLRSIQIFEDTSLRNPAGDS